MKPLADDILTGAGQIAAYIGWPKRRVFYLLEGGSAPRLQNRQQVVRAPNHPD